MASKSAKESPASLLRLEAKSIRRKVEQCCFPYCEECSGVGSEANLEKLNKSLTEFRIKYHHPAESCERDVAIRKLHKIIIGSSCVGHMGSVQHLFAEYGFDDRELAGKLGKMAHWEEEKRRQAMELEEKDARSEDGISTPTNSELLARPASTDAPATHVISQPKQISGSTIAKKLSTKAKNVSYFDEDLRTRKSVQDNGFNQPPPLSTSSSNIFDEVSHSIEGYIPATDIGEDAEPAQKLWNRNGREGSSTAGASIQDITEHHNRSSIGFKDDINGQNEAGFEHDDESYHATLDNNEQCRTRQSTPSRRTPVEREKSVEDFHSPAKLLKLKSKYLEILLQDLGPQAKREGFIYITRDTHDTNIRGLLKVGVTDKLERRYGNSERCDRKHNMQFMKICEPFIGAERVEKLIQADFYRERRVIRNCAWCHEKAIERNKGGESDHVEWFEVEMQR